MYKFTSLELANTALNEIISLIDYEYGFVNYAHHEHARDTSRFDVEEERQQYLLWSGGQLEEMGRVRNKMRDILYGKIQQD